MHSTYSPMDYQEFLRKEQADKEKKATDPKHIEKGLSHREELELHGNRSKEKIQTR